MALTLKDQFQIKTVPAYQAADGKRFHDLTEARVHTRDKMLESMIATAIKDHPEFARLDKPLLKEFLLKTGTVAGKIMAEPLEPSVPPVAAIKVEASADDDLAERLRRLAAAGHDATTTPVMPRTQNPDIFRNGGPANSTIAAARAVDADLEREVEAELARQIG